MSTIRVQTAQNVALEYEVASVGDRILAQLLDWLVLLVVTTVVSFLVDKVTEVGDERRILLLILVGLPILLYHPLCEIFFNGQSLGKRARQIKVTKRDGSRPQAGDYLLRWLLGLIEITATAGSIATVAVLLNGRGQRLGDLAANTVVVSLKPGAATELGAEVELLSGYQVVFPQAGGLTDHDVNLVRRLLHQSLKRHDFELLNQVANKVKALTGIQTDLQDEAFLRTILRDHAHLIAEPA
ncbi:RDD family protein [Hymenobacter persicinus]|uniref:RDD family protein n=1 Tax=Hymenobacter persicinus TaxID=2025506 RepID=A0A4Q5L8L6_9BACT|nr:RDD family protein [Hymenobacter persicinus]RYU78000.1 RDD family protein [Hymenobacter persicinus]